MADTELKTRSLRIDENTYSKFEELSRNFDNKNQCIASLLAAYEIENNKALMPQKRKEIETFQALVTNLNEMYNKAIKDNEQTETRVRVEFSRQLDTKDNTIESLQYENKKNIELEKAAKQLEKKIEELEKQLEHYRNEAKEKNKTIEILSELSEQQKAKIHEFVLSENQFVDYQKKISALENNLKESEEKLKRQEREFELTKKEMKLEKDNELLELKQELDRKLAETVKDYIDKMNTMISEKTIPTETITTKPPTKRKKKTEQESNLDE